MPLLGENSRPASAGGKAPPLASNRMRSDGWSDGELRSPGESGTPGGPGLASPGFAGPRPESRRASITGLGGLLSTCANPECGSGWLHLWRSRSAPIFEGGWSCSSACTTARMEAAVRRELEGRRTDSYDAGEAMAHRHRVPLGLVMLEQGWINSEQLRKALEAQKSAAQGKLGQWLVRQQAVTEQQVTRALSLQWSCAVLPLDYHEPEAMAPALPRLFIEAFGALPLRVAAGKILYLGFEDRLDPVVALATERMLGLRVEAGLVRGSLYRSAHARILQAGFPAMQLIETASESPLVRVLSRAVERFKPVESRLVRMHDCLWLRMWSRFQTTPIPGADGVEDVICSLVAG